MNQAIFPRQYSPRCERPLRIGYVMQSLRTGGLEALVVRLAQTYKEQGHAPEVFAYEEGELREVLEESGIPVHCEPKPSGYHPMFTWRLGQLFRQRQIDALHTHHFGPLLYVAPASFQLGIPLVHTMHSNEHLGPESWRHRLMYKAFSKACRSVTTVSHELADFLVHELKLPKDKVRPVINGVDAGRFCGNADLPLARQGEWRRLRGELSIPEGATVVGIVARLEPEKCHLDLIQALSMTNANTHLMIIGEGSQRPQMEERIRTLGLEGRAHVVGRRRDIPELLRAMDIFAMASSREGLPLAMLEAMATGLPVVSTSVGGIPQLLISSRGGTIVPVSRPDQLAYSLNELAGKPKLAKEMGQRGQAWVRQHYSQAEMARQYMELYQEAEPVRLFGRPNTRASEQG